MCCVSVITTNEEFSALKEEWNSFLRKSASDTIFLTWEWLYFWWKNYGDNGELWIIKVEKQGNLIGLAPLFIRAVKGPGFLQYRGIFFIGDGSADSDYLDFIALKGFEEIVVKHIFKFLFIDSTEWDLLFLNEIPERSPFLQYVRNTVAEFKGLQEESFVPCMSVSLPQSWDAYLGSLKPRIRTKIRSLTKNLEKRFIVKFDWCQNLEQIQERLESLFLLHECRWSLEGKKGVFSSMKKRSFYDDMSKAFLKKGWLRFYSLAVDGQYQAHQFCFQYENKLFLLQEGYNPEWGEYGVGNVLRAYVFRDAIDRHLAMYDFLGGVTFHKQSWGGTITQSVRAIVGRPSLKNRLFLEVPRAIQLVKETATKIFPEQWVNRAKGFLNRTP